MSEARDVVRPVPAALLMRAHLKGDRAAVTQYLRTEEPLELIAGLMSLVVCVARHAWGDVDQLDAHLRDSMVAWLADEAKRQGPS